MYDPLVQKMERGSVLLSMVVCNSCCISSLDHTCDIIV